MALEIESTIYPTYICIRFQGNFELHDALKQIANALRQAAEAERSLVLIDVRDVTGRLSTIDRYEFGVGLAAVQEKIGQKMRLAFVGAPPIIELARFGETVALNRGVQAQAFFDFDQAITWLTQT